MRRKAQGRRAHGGTHSTTASEAPCQHCRRPLLYAWDEGLRVRVDAAALDEPVAAALREVGVRVYALTHGRNLVHETVERAGSLRLVRTRHAEHVCRQRPQECAPVVHKQLEIFSDASVRPPARRDGGQW